MNPLNKFQTFIRTLQFASSLRRNLNRHSSSIPSVEAFLSRNLIKNCPSSSSLDLGCGTSPQNPFEASTVFGIDLMSSSCPQVMCADLSYQPIPFDDSSFHYCTAFDFLEHIPRSVLVNGVTRFSFVELMSEIYRVLLPDGLFLHLTPAFPSKQAFQDPTHLNIITEDTLETYFCEPRIGASALGYGFNGRFRLLDQAWVDSIKLISLLQAVK